MSDRKLANAAQTLFRQVVRLYHNLSKGVVTWLLRTAFVTHRRGRYTTAGFVLPTTVLLILVVALTVGALTFRAFNTSNRTIGDIQSKVIYNAATPAIDRARAKLEFLFDDTKETRYNPGSVPPEDYLLTMLINDGRGIRGGADLTRLPGENPVAQPDAYTLRDETRINIGGDSRLDNAWVYRDPTTKSTIIYSITLATPRPEVGAKDSYTRLTSIDTGDLAYPDKPDRPLYAETLNSGIANYVRTGPVTNASASACNRQTSSNQAGQGWLQDPTSSAIQRKRFQIDAFVVPDNAGDPGRPNNFTTLEMAQDRQQDLGNKWGAWFRNDMEIFPGPQFNWNGAMHTEGSLIIGNGSFSAYLISSPASCLFFESASEITVTNVNSAAQGGDFLGAIASGKINDNSFGGGSLIYLHSANPKTTVSTLDSGRDWVTGSSPWNIASSARTILLRDGYQANSGTNNRANVTVNQNFRGRFAARYEPAPYVDDLYRADDRYGPKKVYKKTPTDGVVPDTVAMGSLIPTSNTTLTRLVSEDPTRDPGNVGLDGYWERRARNEGLRLIVGQRLELGNTNGWVAPQDRPTSRPPASYGMNNEIEAGDGLFQLRNPSYGTVTAAEQVDPFLSDNEGDPLYPSNVASTSHEARQRRTLRDNIAATQGLAVYHAAVDPDYPLACMASTAHPGSPITLRQSINFVPTFFKDGATTNDTLLLTDFLQGRGTNGWEFQPPTKAEFVQAMDDADSSWRVALKNLAQFAGDYVSETRNGAFPPTQEAGQIHPAPELAMWGNFSDLRRTIARLEGGATYASLSIADKTNLQTATCTLGMLAYNIDQVLKFDPSNPQNDGARGGITRNVMFELASDLYSLIDGINDPATGNFEVLEKANLSTYSFDSTVTTPVLGNYNARDYDYVPAEAFLGKLREKLEWQYLNGGSVPGSSNPKYRLAELIFSYFQIRRDRVYGFRPSPAAYTWNYNPYYSTVGGVVQGWSSACDPNIFTFLTADPKVRQSQYESMNAFKTANSSANGFLALPEEPRFRLALSRLCGTVVPPGAIRDYPGDINYPPFGDADYGPETEYLPQPDPRPIYPGNSQNRVDNEAAKEGRPQFIDLGLIKAQGNDATRFPANQLKTPGASGNNGGSIPAYYLEMNNPDRIYYKRAMVAPKWPSLYYLFPEFDHDHDGALTQLSNEIPDPPTNYLTDYSKYLDHRQPTGDLAALDCVTNSTLCQLVTPSGNRSGQMINAYQPWAEPYITNAYIRNTVNSTSRATYRKVDDLAAEIGQAFLGYKIQMPDYTIPRNDPKNGVTAPDPQKVLRYTLRAFDTAAVPATSLSSIALKPRKMPSAVGSNPGPLVNNEDWKLPIAQAPTSPPPQNTPPNRILVPNANNATGRVAIIPFLDRVIYNGRERMPVRVLDLDIGLMRRSPAARDVNTDVLLPVSGIVYGFREDAVREDAIERPAGTNSYNDATAGTDPPLQSTSADPSATNRVSTKVIDFYADPERRPYGFRLRNGSQLQRHASLISASGPITPDQNIRGLSLFTDNPVYVMGDYNLHQNGDDDTVGTALEEFQDTRLQSLNRAYDQDEFYDRRQIDSNFAQPTVDRWRPSEILSDAVTIISENFCDGSVLDTVMTAGQDNGASLSETSDDPETVGGVTFGAYRRVAGTTGAADIYDDQQNGLFGPSCNSTNSSNRTSFLNQGRPVSEPPYGSPDNKRWWMRDNPADRFSPIKVSRNGDLLVYPNPGNRAETPSMTNNTLAGMKPRIAGLYSGNYYDMVRGDGAGNTDRHGRTLISARDTKVNSIVVSGLSPSQVNQSYGGLHNFPRFIETWSGRNLWFAGSLLQLSFSNYASTPFDQDAWEPGIAPTGSEVIPYYSPPNRLWGYDVGLQFAQAGPAASRFVTPGKVRNEFYSEPAANDPYMNKLCTALKANAPTGTSLNNLRCPT